MQKDNKEQDKTKTPKRNNSQAAKKGIFVG
jgi:hypothetical protein